MKNKFFVGLFLISSLVPDIFAHSDGVDDEHGMMGYGMIGGTGMGFSWLILILIVVFAYFMFNKSNNQNESDGDKPSAKDILDKKFANGEIDEDEYKKKKEILK